MKFRNIAAITIGTIAMATTTFCASNINVTLNGLAISFGDAKPEIINGRTMVPVRGLFEKMGYSIKWDSATRTALLALKLSLLKQTKKLNRLQLFKVMYFLKL